jgi:hypothetical protein
VRISLRKNVRSHLRATAPALAPDLHNLDGTSFDRGECGREGSLRRQWVRWLREYLNTVRRRTKRGGLQKVAGSLVLAAAMSGCEGWGPHDTVTSPSNDTALIASMSAPIISPNGETAPSVRVIPFRCSIGAQFTGPLDITMTAGHDVNLHKVTIRLVGTSAVEQSSGPVQATNTFDSDDLASAFGTTQILGGNCQNSSVPYGPFVRPDKCGVRRGRYSIHGTFGTAEQHHGDGSVRVGDGPGLLTSSGDAASEGSHLVGPNTPAQASASA